MRQEILELGVLVIIGEKQRRRVNMRREGVGETREGEAVEENRGGGWLRASASMDAKFL